MNSNIHFFIVGDSHVRTFPVRKNIHPVFLKPGKYLNFLNDNNSFLTQNLIIQLLDYATRDVPKPVLVIPFGEASTRYALNRSWEPNNCSPTVSSYKIVENESRCFINLLNVIHEKFFNKIEIYVVTPPLTFRTGQNLLIENITKDLVGSASFYRVINGLEFSKNNFNSLFQIYSDSIHCNIGYGTHLLNYITDCNSIENLISWPQQPEFNWLSCFESFLCYKFKVESEKIPYEQLEFKYS